MGRSQPRAQGIARRTTGLGGPAETLRLCLSRSSLVAQKRLEQRRRVRCPALPAAITSQAHGLTHGVFVGAHVGPVQASASKGTGFREAKPTLGEILEFHLRPGA